MALIAADMGRLVRMLCALALLCVGFAHGTPALDTRDTTAGIAAYMLPDGTLPALCLSGHKDDGKHGGHDVRQGCEACRISASCLVPPPADQIGITVARAPDGPIPARQASFHRRMFSPGTPPRGPPADLIA